ncbi:MAG: hypothetical protein HWD85_07880 [Flavobacteriaceae bacterium]|nr:hypothetical protein [Flavobacteriaceae bacterium]
MFQYYQISKFNNWRSFFDAKSENNSEKLIQELEQHYKKASIKLGYNVLPNENDINTVGYQFMDAKKYDKAHFQLNINNYPNSANVYDSMGDCFLNQSKKEEAIKYFKRALELGATQETKSKLDSLINK